MDWATLKAQVASGKFAGITSDSREVAPGFLFVAVSGTSQDGHLYIPEVRKKGAQIVVGERAGADIVVKDSRQALAELAADFYGNPAQTMSLAAVTGTSGKTTTTYILESILEAAGEKAGVIGTVNFRFGEKIYPSTHTTPGAVELQKLLAEMKSDGCTHVVMEVSSHALKQYRVGAIPFDVMAFTNLTPEHLDYHPDIEDYFNSKAMLFRDFFELSEKVGKRPSCVVNADDPHGRRLLGELTASHPARPESVRAFSPGMASLQESLTGISGTVADLQIHSRLMGRFNLYNLLCAIEMARSLGIAKAAIENGVSRLPGVPGRMESIANSRGIHVFVDYAHKSDAFEKVLINLKALKRPSQRLITVFGCGGDRDAQKRPVMGRLAVEHSDEVIVTWDNPRTEDPTAITDAIVAGIRGFTGKTPLTPYRVEPDRKKAIETAIGMARPGDLVLIAGKGHEDYQILGKTKVHFDDREVARQALIS